MSSVFQRALAGVLVSLAVLASSAQAQTDEFTVILLPDTQFYSESYPYIFNAQTQWIVDHQSDLNIKFVLGLGDIVNVGSDLTQWANANSAIRTLDNNGIPYLLAIGNKDYQDITNRVVTNFNTYFGPNRYSGYPWYKGSTVGGSYPQGSNENYYGVFTVNGKQFVIVLLEFMPRDAALQWADSVLNRSEFANSDAMIVTHSFENKDNTREDICDSSYAVVGNRGEDMWTKFVKRHSNIIMVVNGHIPGTGRRKDIADTRNLVNQMLSDYQGMTNGGNGYLRILRFKPSLNQISVQTYSPYLNAFMTDSANQFTIAYRGSGNAALKSTIAGKVRIAKIGSSRDCTTVTSAIVSTGSQSATTDSAGNYSLSGLSQATYDVTASATNLNPITTPILASGGYSERVEFFMSPDFGSLTGTVKNSAGTAISGATVQVVGGVVTFNKKATTSSSGKFTFSKLAVGQYTVTVSKSGYTTTTSAANVVANSTTSVTIALN